MARRRPTEDLVADYLARGGKVKRCPPGGFGELPHAETREAMEMAERIKRRKANGIPGVDRGTRRRQANLKLKPV